ncbi:pyocin knob domain-containing protein [Bacillus ndiopicus]|uniref:pyocin knob domain-containing protein n=1 Tax=Bacillus ndiopicus TaxID=1347368 RepID=UPI0005AB40EC|nr:pyocin knob domain-containing protein [Bacillus ndiopicus]
MTLYNTKSPITREERNNINATWQDILNRFANLQYQIKLLAGGEEVNELLQRIETAIQNAETAVQSYIAQVDENVQQSIVAVNELITELTDALYDTQQAINNANAATTNATDAADAANNKVAEATQLLTALELLQDELQEMRTSLTLIASNAQEATQDAIEATGAANTATTNAQIAADNANDATTVATSAANRANTAAEAIEGWGTARAWNSTANYIKNNFVTDEGSTWQALRPNSNVKPVEGQDWTCIARRGIDGQGAISTISHRSPTPDGNFDVEMQDVEGLNAALQELEDLVNSIVETGVAKLVHYPYTIQASSDGQSEIEIPLTTFDKDTDTVLLIKNSIVLYETKDYSITDKKITLVNPVGVASDTSFYMLILKNVPMGEEGGVSASVLTDGSIAKRKLEQALQDEIDSKANSSDLSSLQQEFDAHKDKSASLTEAGHVQLSNTLTPDETKALTPKAVHDLPWQKHKLTESSGQAVNLFTDTNLNDVVSTGLYRAFFATSPVGEIVEAGTYSLFVIKNHDSSNAVTQMLIGENTAPGRIYTRSRNSAGIWSKWIKQVSSNLTWVEATLQNGWQQASDAVNKLKYTKDDLGFVHLQGIITDGIANEGITVMTLPIGFRPVQASIPITAIKSQDLTSPIVQVNNFGNVVINKLGSTGTVRINGFFYAG